MLPDIYGTFKQMIDRPHGIVLVTGRPAPANRPRSTPPSTRSRNDTVKIITVEDPVEYQQPQISQNSVHSKIGLTFGPACAASCGTTRT